MGWSDEITGSWTTALCATTGEDPSGLEEAVPLLQRAYDNLPDAGPHDVFGRGRRRRRAMLATELSRHAAVGMMLADAVLARLVDATGRTREDLLAEVVAETAQRTPAAQIRVLAAEVGADLAVRAASEPDKPWPQFAERLERILRLAEQEATNQASGREGPRPEPGPATDRT